jgi:hypothetical protein
VVAGEEITSPEPSTPESNVTPEILPKTGGGIGLGLITLTLFALELGAIGFSMRRRIRR